ncbi:MULTISPECIES: LysM domain-containing protein [unclassified Pseudomonas]|uniref:LysM peptidoglycan-binding domain-containing protein n=1 Tax=unclassified Pseudomonas TaxID=196821 RepID=UPI002AC96851|nr:MULTISPECIES: LysM domain-containing protein [unclassified Pseudomonas]MEB0048822.1 LysM domain-containing protein [Pseudomonas sp. Dout3]MEB0099627.1 LysM domain-containing protein [Pseudomonas sp. DC1.2]WPX59569.1 LysM domain-containing protein [Pseudomonas sp. DC1.2]
MNSTYTVKHGDTLGKIAQQHGAKAADIQALNPMISNPHYLRPGWELKLPASAAPNVILPPLVFADSLTCTAIEGQPDCKEELVDIAHITGEPYFHILTDDQSKALKREISAVQTLMDELHQNLANALPISQCNKLQNPDAVCACTACVKDAWAIKAEGAGLLIREPRPVAVAAPLTTANDFQGQLRELQEIRDWYRDYRPSFGGAQYFESNWTELMHNKTRALDHDINRLRTQLTAQRSASPVNSSTHAKNAAPTLNQGKGIRGETQRGKQTRTGLTVVEVMVFSDPTRRHYIPARFRETTRWNVQVSTRVLAGKTFSKQLAGDLIKDIKNSIGSGRKAGPLGSLELKISSWASEEDNLLNTLHQQVAWSSNQSDAARYAVSSEAHALRFAASASAGVNSWNPRQGSIEVGVKGNAAFSLAEAAVSLNTYFPSQGGYVAHMAYRNAEGLEVVHPMGVFRVSGKLELSCFVGAKAQGEAGVTTHYKPDGRAP